MVMQKETSLRMSTVELQLHIFYTFFKYSCFIFKTVVDVCLRFDHLVRIGLTSHLKAKPVADLCQVVLQAIPATCLICKQYSAFEQEAYVTSPTKKKRA